MQLFISILIVVLVEAIMATLIATRAWQYLPSRWFVALVSSFAITNILSYLRSITSNPVNLTIINNLTLITIGSLQVIMMILLSLLFMPIWWVGKRPIRWILLPYIFFMFLLVADLVGGLQLFVQAGMLTSTGERIYIQPGRTILLFMFVVGWLVQIAMLIAAYKRYPERRRLILLLIGSLFFSIVSGLLLTRFKLPGILSIVTITMPLLCTLAYTVLRTDMILPVRTALDKALHNLNDIVIVVDRAGKAIYVNPAAYTLGVRINQPLPDDLRQVGFDISSDTPEHAQLVTLEESQYVLTQTYVHHRNVAQQTTLLLARDVTDIREHTRKLEDERAALTTTVKQLNKERDERQLLESTMHQMAQPIIPVLPGVLVVPLVGEFNAARWTSFTNGLLQSVERERVRCVLVDLTGVTFFDEVDAHMLLNVTKAMKLLGARSTLIGVRPELSQTLVALNVPLESLETSATLQQAVQKELLQT